MNDLNETEYYFREALLSDMDKIFEWANDPQVRANAFNTEPIPYENHVRWYNRMLEDNEVLQYIFVSKKVIDGNIITEDIGQIRLNVEDTAAFIDYSIAPNLRGKGLGSKMLRALVDMLEQNKNQFDRLIGQVKYTNIASALAFTKCGFQKEEQEDFLQFVYKLRH